LKRPTGTARTEAQVRHRKVNGPEDSPRFDLDAVEWDSIDWQEVEREVRRLRQRIFKATQEGNLAKVRGLQKLMR
jgi:RNA-directed DNA polymerase